MTKVKAIDILRKFKYLGKNENNYSVDGDTTPSFSYLKRSFENGAIKINHKTVRDPFKEIDEELYHVKFHNRTIF